MHIDTAQMTKKELSEHEEKMKNAEILQYHEPETDHAYPDSIFPQLLGGKTNHITEQQYCLRDKEDALAYWNEPMLSKDMKELAQAMLDSDKTLWQMMGNASCRVQASMTLFWLITQEPVFMQMLDKFYKGELHKPTVERLRETE